MVRFLLSVNENIKLLLLRKIEIWNGFFSRIQHFLFPYYKYSLLIVLFLFMGTFFLKAEASASNLNNSFFDPITEELSAEICWNAEEYSASYIHTEKLETASSAMMAMETIPAGSFIINMGITPQTYANGLKPYGLIYELMKTHNVPIKWVIADGKAKDGTDFIHNGIDYKGGTFIVPAEYRSTAVNAVIASFQGQGVVGATSTADFTEDIDYTLVTPPTWVLDLQNGKLAKPAFENAGIPTTAYSEKLPAALDCCDYMYVMPHADPEWSSHSRLYAWMKDDDLADIDGVETCRGWFWGACHAVSVIENVTNPSDATQRLNFLSEGTTGSVDAVPDLLDFGSHDDGSAPYTYDYETHPFMQFMGTFDGATENGSEQVYMPDLGAAWRPGVTIGTEDETQADVPPNGSDSPGEAVGEMMQAKEGQHLIILRVAKILYPEMVGQCIQVDTPLRKVLFLKM